MALTYEITFGAESRYVEPLNSDDIDIVDRFVDENYAWLYVKDISDVEIYGDDYNWLYALMTANKCSEFNIEIKCDDDVKYNGRFNYYTSEIDYDHCIIKITLTSDTYTTDLLGIIDEERDAMTLAADATVTALAIGIGYNDAKKLNDVINGYITGVGMTLQSEFLQNAISPLFTNFPAGTFQVPFDWYSTNVNPFTKLYLTLSSAIVDRKMNMSLGYLLKELCKSLNLRWTVDNSAGKLIIEHVEYFKHGMQYGNGYNVSVDVTTIDGGKWIEETSKINYTTYQFPITEARWPKFSSNYGVLLVNDCVMKGSQHDDIRPEFENDIETVESEQNECTLLMACYENLGNILVYEHNFSGQTINNYPFYNIIAIEYWLYDRCFPTVYAAIGTATDWNTKSQKEIRKQENVEVPVCCLNINPYFLVTTQYGNGQIITYQYKLSTGMGKFALKYSDI